MRGHPVASAHAFHCSTVTSYLPIANGWPTLTRCTGRSAGSSELLPISNVPPGSATSAGQVSQSLISPAVETAVLMAGLGAGVGGGAEMATDFSAGAGADGASGADAGDVAACAWSACACACDWAFGAAAEARSRSIRA